MACDKQTKITKHDRFGIFRSRLEMLMSGILKDDAYLYYKYGLFMGMEDKSLSRHYPCHSEMITCSLSAHKQHPAFPQETEKNNQGMWALGAVQVLDTCNVQKR